MPTIPASDLVSVVPSVLAAGGDALTVQALMLDTQTNGYRVPYGTVKSFASAAAVAAFFGATSEEAAQASVYFGGFSGCTALPASLLITQLPLVAVPAYLQGGNISALPLATLQGYSGLLSILINGITQSASVSLAAATSFSNAASLIGSTLQISGPPIAQITGSIGGTTLQVISVVSGGPIAVGDVVTGTGVSAGTFITGLLSGTGATGTYTVNQSQTAPNESMTVSTSGVTYDSVSGSFFVFSSTTGSGSTIAYATGVLAPLLLLTQVTGAVLSQGAGAVTSGTAAAFMNAVIAQTTNWVTYMTIGDPDQGSGNTFKQALAVWKDSLNNRYCYVCTDTDVNAANNSPSPTSLGALLAAVADSGTVLIYEQLGLSGQHIAAFFCGAAASINYNQINGRITFAYKNQPGRVAAVTSDQVAKTLLANGYDFYGAYGAANQNYVWFQNSSITGEFLWADSYINQIVMNNAFQVALLSLLQSALSIPYDTLGTSLIENALQGPINQFGIFGAFAPGPLTPAQVAQVNAAAGANVASTLQTQGYYLQVLQASPTVRAARQSPPINFWYIDEGSVQVINMASIEVQ